MWLLKKTSVTFVLVISLISGILFTYALPAQKAGAISGTPSTGSEADEKIIWDFFMDKLKNAYGVAGLMGNLYAESELRSNNLQDSYEKRLGYTDVTYTKAVDEQRYKNFVYDSAGYGLAQWGYRTRKKALLEYAQGKNKSVGDLQTQLEFLYIELTGSYGSVVTALKNASSLSQASNAVLFDFESPSDQSLSVQRTRTSYGKVYYDKYAVQITPEPDIVFGDVDGDGTVTQNDYLALKAYFKAEGQLGKEQLEAADADGNGRLTVTDYIIIKRIISGNYFEKK